jgi:hypothetical protein
MVTGITAAACFVYSSTSLLSLDHYDYKYVSADFGLKYSTYVLFGSFSSQFVTEGRKIHVGMISG